VNYILAVILLAVVFGVGAWDVAAISLGRPRETVSNVLQGWAMSFPVLPLAVGVILGHVFWPHAHQKIVIEPAGIKVEAK
jgi:hypothetical protein